MDKKYNADVIVVGAGPSGISAALEVARSGKKVVLVERAQYPGSKNMYGGAVYTTALKEVFKEDFDAIPYERVINSHTWAFLSDNGSFNITNNDYNTKDALAIKRFNKMFNTPDVELHDFDKIKEYHIAQEDFRNQWGYISLNYLYNDYICSNFVQGANGWCHPDGTIDYHFNIGKWPEVEEVLEDLNQLIQAFPFLELEVTLFDDEYCINSTNALVSFLVRDRKVELIDPSERNIHKEFSRQLALVLTAYSQWREFCHDIYQHFQNQDFRHKRSFLLSNL